jgi:hypothetical protein
MKPFSKFFLIAFLTCSTSLLAQESRVIKGRIISEEDQEPLPQALIMSSNKNGVLANNDGFFLISLSS